TGAKAVGDTGAGGDKRGVDDPIAAKPDAPKKKRKPRPDPDEYWPGTGWQGPPTQEHEREISRRRRQRERARQRRQQQQQQPSTPPPPPPEPTVGVKDQPDRPEGTHDTRDTRHVGTAPVSDEKVLRSEGEKARGAQPLDSDAHHIAEKSAPDPKARRIR